MKNAKILFVSTAVSVMGLSACNSCYLDFGDPAAFPLNTTFSAPNTLVISGCNYNGFTDAIIVNGVSYFGGLKIKKDPAYPNNPVNHLHTMASTLRLEVIGRPLISKISIEFVDMGGMENVFVNGVLYSGEIKNVPNSLGGANIRVYVNPLPHPLSGSQGSITFEGGIKELKIGGMEFSFELIHVEDEGEFY
jgi:hypothetical protein